MGLGTNTLLTNDEHLQVGRWGVEKKETKMRSGAISAVAKWVGAGRRDNTPIYMVMMVQDDVLAVCEYCHDRMAIFLAVSLASITTHF